MCTTQHSSTSSKRWREFGWKNLFRFFITPQIKHKQLRTQQPCWRLCGHINVNHSHIFWSCPKIRLYWEEVLDRTIEILGYEVPRDPQVIFLGLITEESVHEEDLYLYKVFSLAGKKAITKNWLARDPPKISDWMAVVGEIFSMERMSALLRARLVAHNSRWRKWTDDPH